jgi:hypothetical protein
MLPDSSLLSPIRERASTVDGAQAFDVAGYNQRSNRKEKRTGRGVEIFSHCWLLDVTVATGAIDTHFD